MKNPRRGKSLSTKIPLYTLSGGVGRQAPSKRLPSESQELINAMVTVERSIEKRPGTDLISVTDPDSNAYTGDSLGLPTDGEYEFFWHALSDDARFLIVIDRSASAGSSHGRDELYYTFFYDAANDSMIRQLPSDQDQIPAEVRAYITFGSDPLKLVSRGQNLVFLNTEVKAGYSSTYDTDNDEWVTHNLDGTQKDGGDSANIDDKGAEEVFLTAVKNDPGGIAVYWDRHSVYARGTEVMVLPGTAEINNSPVGSANGIYQAETTQQGGSPSETIKYYILRAQRSIVADSAITDLDDWVVVATDNSAWDENSAPYNNLPSLDQDRIPARIEVKDWQYPDSTKPQLGQSLPTFNDLTIPPLKSDVEYGNNNAVDMFGALYGLDTNSPVTTDSANGKVYFIQAGYQGQTPGYYIAKSTTTPSFEKVRTPDAYSLLDVNRMPMELEFVGGDDVTKQWQWSTIDWAPRTSGDKKINPGPTPFKDGRMSAIKTIAFFRNRLFLSAGDVIFSSRDGDFTDLWIEDPGIIVDTDPIDVAASSNQFTPITSMVPFNEYMFINTNADTQYELMGSENQITPFTAQLQPMTFYSTAPLVDPVTLGNNIFFYDAERLYLYFGRGGTLATAQELSAHCPKYLPTSFGPTAVAAAQDTLMVVDADNTSDVYAYTTRYRGDEVVQNAFYKYEYAGGDVQAMHSWDNHVYTAVNRNGSFFIERQLMRYDEPDIPRLDRKQRIPLFFNLELQDFIGGTNAVFNAATSETIIRVPFVISPAELDEYEVVGTDGTAFTLCGIAQTSTDDWTDICVSGNVQAASVYVGRKFTMSIQLSPQFVRDQQNNPQEGILNLASMVTRHFETGNYDVVAQRRGRPVADIRSDYNVRDTSLMDFTTTFSAIRTDTFDDSNLGISNTDYQGELVSKIMGFSDKVDLYILSDYFTPVNITNLEIRGKFKATYSSIT